MSKSRQRQSVPTDSFEETQARWERNNLRFHHALLVLTFVLAVWMMGPIGFLFWLPLFAWYASRGLVNSASDCVGHLRAKKWAPKAGTYHAYDDREVRVFCDDGGVCRVAASDAFRAIGKRLVKADVQVLARRYPPEHFSIDRNKVAWLSEAAVLEWLGAYSARMDREALRFQRWLEREVFPPLRTKHERGIGAAQNQRG